ncbi:hypothetical protein ACWDRR_18485 [Kitasatospora sp. NPDC003701]
MVDPRGSSGYLWPYCSPAFSRPVAERILVDLDADNCGLTGRWDGDALVFEWTPDYDGDGGTETVAPDEHGRYSIGGRWPWDYDGPLDAAERHQAALARSTARLGSSMPPAAEPVAASVGRAGTPAPGR